MAARRSRALLWAPHARCSRLLVEEAHLGHGVVLRHLALAARLVLRAAARAERAAALAADVVLLAPLRAVDDLALVPRVELEDARLVFEMDENMISGTRESLLYHHRSISGRAIQFLCALKSHFTPVPFIAPFTPSTFGCCASSHPRVTCPCSCPCTRMFHVLGRAETYPGRAAVRRRS